MAGAAIESQAAIDPAMPATGARLAGYKGPSQGNHWTIDQLNNMLVAGGSPLQIAADYTGNHTISSPAIVSGGFFTVNSYEKLLMLGTVTFA